MKTKFRLPIKARYFLYTLLAVVYIFGLFTPFIDWAKHPELTQMQIFLKWWWIWLVMIFSGGIGGWIIPNNR